MTLQQAFEIVLALTRAVQLNADQHEQRDKATKIVYEALFPKTEGE